jgi:hypothetical protein
MAGSIGLAERCLDAADGDPWRALALALKMTRYRMIIDGRIEPEPDEPLPVFVRAAVAARRARRRLARV